MRCLLVSDLHYCLPQYDWVYKECGDFDVVVIAGDHLDIASEVELRSQIIVIQTYLKKIATRTSLVVCSGNHDLDSRNSSNEKYASWILKARQYGVPTDHDSFMVEDNLITICPWWDGPETAREVGRLFERDAARAKRRWIWVYHAPPDNSPTSWDGHRYLGDRELVHWINDYAPDMVLTGHIHQSPFRKPGSWVDRLNDTWVFNAGRQPGPCPTHIIIDTAVQEAVWFSLAGAESVKMSLALTRPLTGLTELPAWLAN